MRKTITLLALLTILLTGLSAAGLALASGDPASVSVYLPTGQYAGPRTSIESDGYIIRCSGTDAVFSSPFGDVSMQDGTLLAITGYDFDNPSIYLLDGIVTLDVTSLASLTVYTTSASYRIGGNGQYIFAYTSDVDACINNSDTTIAVYDALRRSSSIIRPYHYSDLMTNQLDRPIVSQTSTQTDDDHYTISGGYSFRGESLVYEFSTSGSGSVTYPASLVTKADIDAFMASYVAHTSIREVTNALYSIPEEGTVLFTYPAIYSEDDIMMVVDDFILYLDGYLSSIFVPSSPSIGIATVTIEEPVEEETVPVQESSDDASLDLQLVLEVEEEEEEEIVPEPVAADEGVEVPEPPFMVEPWVTVTD